MKYRKKNTTFICLLDRLLVTCSKITPEQSGSKNEGISDTMEIYGALLHLFHKKYEGCKPVFAPKTGLPIFLSQTPVFKTVVMNLGVLYFSGPYISFYSYIATADSSNPS